MAMFPLSVRDILILGLTTVLPSTFSCQVREDLGGGFSSSELGVLCYIMSTEWEASRPPPPQMS